VLILFFLCITVGLGEAQTGTLEQILPPSTFQRYQSSEYPDQLKIIRMAIQNTCSRLRIQIGRGEKEAYLQRLDELEILGKEGLTLSSQVESEKMRRSREVKRLEIFLRQTIDLLEDLKLDVPFDIRDRFYPAKEALDSLRNQLFLQLFEGARSFRTNLGPEAMRFSTGELRSAVYHPAAAQGLHTLDRFTEEEFSRIQEARTLEDRVKVILKIAENRLDEIDRRRKGEEWEEDEPNPLEFYSYDDLLFAYNRAMSAAMNSIDDDFERGLSRMDEIEGALKVLDKKAEDFASRLKELETLIRERKSLDLAMQLNKAEELTDTAIKGAQSGLESIRKRKD